LELLKILKQDQLKTNKISTKAKLVSRLNYRRETLVLRQVSENPRKRKWIEGRVNTYILNRIYPIIREIGE
jgi:hypothetical protein